MPKKGFKSERTEKILHFLSLGWKNHQICKTVGCSQESISSVKKRNGISTSRKRYCWKDIQSFYDIGNSYRECQKEFGVCAASLFKAVKRGDFKTRTTGEGLKIFYKRFGGRKHSDEQKKKLSFIVNEKVKNGTWHYSFSKVRTHSFNSKFAGNVKLMGRWELEYAKYLDLHNIKWRRPNEKFYYEFSGNKCGKGYYIPDFYLIESSEYIEIKGYATLKDEAKWKWFPSHLKLKILKREDLIKLGLDVSDKNYIPVEAAKVKPITC